jgi:RimJ/RimL family protein N-acetyltransferase
MRHRVQHGRYRSLMPSSVPPSTQTLPPPKSVTLRPITLADIPALYENQCDPVANEMAMVNPRTREAFDEVWNRIISSPPNRLVARVIDADGEMVGTINCFQRPPSPEEAGLRGITVEELDYVGYWLARAHWNRGIATRALTALLQEVGRRPLYARAARSNTASLRVLEHCGFTITAYHHSPADDPRFPACEEALLLLK